VADRWVPAFAGITDHDAELFLLGVVDDSDRIAGILLKEL
jgi:hypothetical protein